MIDCLSNLEICKAGCCKSVIFYTPDLKNEELKFYEECGCKVGKFRGKQTYLVVPLRCKALTEDNKCSIHDSPIRPRICQTLDYGNIKGCFITEGCLLKMKV